MKPIKFMGHVHIAESHCKHLLAEFNALNEKVYAAELTNARHLADKDTLRQRFCGTLCHGDDLFCFYQGGDEWNPCPLATEADKKAFLATTPQQEVPK